jgi:hypothetical protein
VGSGAVGARTALLERWADKTRGGGGGGGASSDEANID